MSEWQPAETAPFDTKILVFGTYDTPEHSDISFMYVVTRTRDTEYPWKTPDSSYCPDFFSHWMPLPRAPNGAELSPLSIWG